MPFQSFESVTQGIILSVFSSHVRGPNLCIRVCDRGPGAIPIRAIARGKTMPFLTSANPTWNKVLLEDLLAALMTRPAGAQLTTPTVHLYTAVSQAISP